MFLVGRRSDQRLAGRLARTVLAAGVACTLLAGAPAAAEGGMRERLSDLGGEAMDGIAVPVDVLLVRPLAVCATIIGAVLFVPALAMGAANDRETLEDGFEIFVGMPAKNVYGRPLGEF